MQIMRFDVVPMPVDVKPHPFMADDQCALNNAMRAHWEMTAKPLGNGPFPIRRVRFDRNLAGRGFKPAWWFGCATPTGQNGLLSVLLLAWQDTFTGRSPHNGSCQQCSPTPMAIAAAANDDGIA